GGESTRPGAQAIPADEQCRRTLGVIEGIRKRSDVAISIDTRDPTVGQRALKAGADIVNDVSACAHPGWVPVLLDRPDVPVVLMHMRGTPETMQTMTSYPDGVLAEIRRFFESRLDELEAAGIGRDRVILDPGIGFAKEAAQNLEVLGGLEELRSLGRPILVGASRKVFLGHLLERATSSSPGARRGALEGSAVTRIPAERDVATVVVHAIAALAGAAILRVHNVGYARDLAHVLEGFARFGTAHERREER
ncbi:MAG TPA: dihydropteroate synthase, partial [Planctomycetota bacterium]|nr:dihydropteroate synthase [Planctomycetota bacterium]